MSPVFYTFNDRERAFGIIEAICGARMHPNWFRIGGVAQDLPQRLGQHVSRFPEIPAATARTNTTARSCGTASFKARTKGVGAIRRRRRSTGASPVPSCAPAASSGISARSSRTPATNSSSSTSLPARRGLLRSRRGARGGDAAEPSHHRAVRRPTCRTDRISRITRLPRRRSRSGPCTISRR